MNANRPLTHADLLPLKRCNTPTIYNGWEQIAKPNPAGAQFGRNAADKFRKQGEW